MALAGLTPDDGEVAAPSLTAWAPSSLTRPRFRRSRLLLLSALRRALGSFAAVTPAIGHREIFVMNADGSAIRQLTTTPVAAGGQLVT